MVLTYEQQEQISKQMKRRNKNWKDTTIAKLIVILNKIRMGEIAQEDLFCPGITFYDFCLEVDLLKFVILKT